MVNEMTLELINVAIDGEASPNEQAELAEILGKSEEARYEFESLSEVVGTIEALPEIPTPTVLEPVMTRLRTRSNPPSAWRVVPGKFARRRALVLGWALAASALIVAVLVPLLRSGTGADSVPAWQMSGSMAPVRPDAWPLVAHAASPSGNLTVTVRRQGARVSVQPFLQGGGDVEIRWIDGAFTRAESAGSTVVPEGSTQIAQVHCSVSACPTVLLFDQSRGGGAVTVSAPGIDPIPVSTSPR